MTTTRTKQFWPVSLLLFASFLTASLTLAIYEDVVVRPIQLPESNELVLLGGVSPETGIAWPQGWNSGAFTELGLFRTIRIGVGETVSQQQVTACLIDSSFFRVLDVHPERGRLFSEADTNPGAFPVAVITDDFWKVHFGAVADISAATLVLSGRRFHVVGVLPQGFSFPGRAQVFLPRPDRQLDFSLTGDLQFPGDVSHGMDMVIGRLRPGVGLVQARAMETEILEDVRKANKDPRHGVGARVSVRQLQQYVTFRVKSHLTLLALAGLFAALVGMGSLVLLSFARASSLEKDIAIRSSLGASLSTLFSRELLWWLGLGFCVSVGVLMSAEALLRIFRSAQGLALPRLDELTLHPGQMLVLVLAVCFTASLLSIPYLFVSLRCLGNTSVLYRVASEPNKTMAVGAGRIILVAQLSFALALAAVTVRVCAIYWQMATAPPGLDPRGVYFSSLSPVPFSIAQDARIDANREKQPKDVHGTKQDASRPDQISDPLAWGMQPLTNDEVISRREILIREVVATAERLGSDSRATTTGVIQPLPYSPVAGSTVAVKKVGPGSADSEIEAQSYYVHGDIPSLFDLSILSGRWFDPADESRRYDSIVISQMLAAKFFSGDAVGKQVWIESEQSPRVVLGVVNDVLSGFGDEVIPSFYVPLAPRLAGSSAQFFLLAKAGGALNLPPPARINSAHLFQSEGWSSFAGLVNDAGVTDRVGAAAAAWFAFLALLLAAASSYAFVWTTTRQRQREMAIRICLGAQPRVLVARTFGAAGLLILLAAALGTFLDRGLEQLLWSKFYSFPPFTWSSVAISLIIVAAATLLSVVIPARSLLRLAPVEIIREN